MTYLTQISIQGKIYTGPEVQAESEKEAERILSMHPLQDHVTGFRVIGRLIEKQKLFNQEKIER